MSHATYHVGPVFDVMARLPDQSIDLVLTSPPFLRVRSYLDDDHELKPHEIGQEGTPAEFVDVMLRLSAEWRRLLAPHGSIMVELGDTFSEGDEGWPIAKGLALTPELYRVGLAYGVNPLTGEESPAGRWRVRNVVRWVRPNPVVGALGDKYRPATSDLVVACVSAKRYFDLDAVLQPLADSPGNRYVRYPSQRDIERRPDGSQKESTDNRITSSYDPTSSKRAPPLDWWRHSTAHYPGAHYAVWPADLLTIPVKSMCPERVCTTCGEPSRRITSEPAYVPSASYRGGHTQLTEANRVAPGVNQFVSETNQGKASLVRTVETVGWSDCGHDTWRPGIVLDPFAGTGTTLAVATGHGRDAIGIDFDKTNVPLAEQRLGLFMDVVHLADAPPADR